MKAVSSVKLRVKCDLFIPILRLCFAWRVGAPAPTRAPPVVCALFQTVRSKVCMGLYRGGPNPWIQAETVKMRRLRSSSPFNLKRSAFSSSQLKSRLISTDVNSNQLRIWKQQQNCTTELVTEGNSTPFVNSVNREGEGNKGEVASVVRVQTVHCPKQST